MPTNPPDLADGAVNQRRAKYAALIRHRSADDPDVLDAKRDLVAEGLRVHIERVLASAPPLTAEQRDRIAAILRSGGREIAS
ncbi:hypothetical protein [Mycobacterium paraintracellulare]